MTKKREVDDCLSIERKKAESRMKKIIKEN